MQAKPTVTTQAAGSVVATTATLNGTVNPNGSATSYHFDYGTTTSYGSQSPAADAGAGSSAVPATADLTGLAPKTTYHFRLVATNGGGTTTGSDLTFTTGDKPAATTQAATSVLDSTATLNGSVTPNRLATTYHFEYGTTTTYGSTSPDAGAGSGTSSVAATANVSALAPNTTYHFRLVATNAAGTTLGSDLTLTTGDKPAVTTSAASSVLDTTAKLNGSVTPNRLATTYHFEYGTTTSYGSTSPDAGAGSGTSSVAASANVSGLAPNTTYHFRLVATNAAGTTVGDGPGLHDAHQAKRDDRLGVGGARHDRDAGRFRRSERVVDHVSIRVRHVHVVRVAVPGGRRGRGLGHRCRAGVDRPRRSGPEHHVPLPRRRDERGRNRGGRRSDVHHR